MTRRHLLAAARRPAARRWRASGRARGADQGTAGTAQGKARHRHPRRRASRLQRGNGDHAGAADNRPDVPRHIPATAGCCSTGAAERDPQMWMKNTVSSLDMLFIGADGTIRRIAEHTVPEASPSSTARAGARDAGTGGRHGGAAGYPRRRQGAGEAVRQCVVALRAARHAHRFRAAVRGVAQPGSARVLGTRGRRFESGRPDQSA